MTVEDWKDRVDQLLVQSRSAFHVSPVIMKTAKPRTDRPPRGLEATHFFKIFHEDLPLFFAVRCCCVASRIDAARCHSITAAASSEQLTIGSISLHLEKVTEAEEQRALDKDETRKRAD